MKLLAVGESRHGSSGSCSVIIIWMANAVSFIGGSPIHVQNIRGAERDLDRVLTVRMFSARTCVYCASTVFRLKGCNLSETLCHHAYQNFESCVFCVIRQCPH